MLARAEKFRCIECGLPYGSPLFHHHYGKIDNGAAYWCDRGVLCSPQCSLKHSLKRRAEGTSPSTPAPSPFEAETLRR